MRENQTCNDRGEVEEDGVDLAGCKRNRRERVPFVASN